MKTLTNCLPLTQEDVFVLRGKPTSKRIRPKNGVSETLLEEWIYYYIQGNYKESYVFKNGKLSGYKKDDMLIC